MIESFTLQQGSLPLLISQPHPGTRLTPEVESALSERGKRREDTDWYIPELYQPIARRGASVLTAHYSRYVVDLNRPEDDVPLYTTATTGLFPGTFFDGEPLFAPGKQLNDQHKATILRTIWQPYHQALRQELQRLQDIFGYVILWDAHSIKSVVPRLFEGRLPDLNFGTDEGRSCSPTLSDALLAACDRFPQYSRVLNGRFKGGYITRHYGQPGQNIHAVQLEIAQDCYLDEQTFSYDPQKSADLQQVLLRLIDTALEWGHRHYPQG